MNPQPERRRLPWLHVAAAAIFLQGTTSLAASAPESINGRVLDGNAQNVQPLQHATTAQLHAAMQRLDWMIGKWEGSGWAESAPLGRHEFSYSLHVRPELDGLLLIVDGVGHTAAEKPVSYAEQLLISGPPPAALPGPPGTYLWQESGRGVYLRLNEAQGAGRSLRVGLPLVREDCDWIVDESLRTSCRTGGGHVWSRATISLNDDNEWVQTREWQVRPGDDRSWHTYFKVVLRRVGQASP